MTRPLRLAYFSPLPPARSGIADYSAELLPFLAQQADVTLFSAEPTAVRADLRSRFPVLPLDSYPDQQWQFDVPLYQMGNSRHHAPLYPLLRRYPGIVVLHDYVLHHFMATQQYSRELGYSLGGAAATATRWGTANADPYQQPLNARVLDAALGVVVHSRFVANQIRARRAQLPIATVPLLVQTPAVTATPDPATVTFCSAGQMTPNRQLPFVLSAFARVHAKHPHSRYQLIGAASDVDVAALLADLPADVRSAVSWHGHVPDLQQFAEHLARADVVINLRYPTAGETSAVAIRALKLGKPLLTFDVGWYAELPDSVALRTPPLDEAALVDAMVRLIDPNIRQSMGQASQAFAAAALAPERAAQRLLTFIDGTLRAIARA